MALQKNFIRKEAGLEGELVCRNAYYKVVNVDGGKDVVRATVEIRNEKDGMFLASERYDFVPSMDGGNFIAQAYDHLKTLPEFADATDC